MRVALVGLTHPFRGGISHYTTLLCRALLERHAVRFYALSRQYPGLWFPGRTQRDESETPLRVPHEACLDSVNPLSWIATARRIRRFAPELLLFSWWHPFFAPAFGSVARLCRRFGGIPSCFLCHNALPHESTFVDRLLLRYAYGSAAAFIAHSAQDRDKLRQLRPGVAVHCNPHPTYAVFAAAEVPRPEQAKVRLGLAERQVLLFFGFVREYKGLPYLLRALDEPGLDPRCHLLVVGEFYDDRERYAPDLERLVRAGRLTLVDRYVPNEEIPLYFSAADLVMVPYLTATQSGVIQMAYGFHKPVVATRVGGIPEAVIEGQTGYLVPPADSAALARAVRTYFESADRERMREAIARENRKYSWERMVETIESVGASLRPAAGTRVESGRG
jgi:glycosyltransferase involved in cell wall biosynthesis